MTGPSTKRQRIEAECRERRDQAFSKVTTRQSYCDTAQMSFRSRLPDGIRAQLLELGAGAVQFYRSEKNWQRCFGVRIAQPTRGALMMINMAIPDHVINRVDFAFDFSVNEYADAEFLRDFMHRHLTQPWHGKCELREFEQTFYFRRAYHGRNVAFYSERRSRNDHTPAFHFELRYPGAAACRRIGVEKIDELLAADPERLAGRDCRLSFIDEETIRKRVLKMADRRARQSLPQKNGSAETRQHVSDRLVCVFAHATRTEHYVAKSLTELPTQALIDSFPRIAKNALIHVPLFG